MTEMMKQAPTAPDNPAGEVLLDIRGLRVDFPDVPGSPAIDGMDLKVGRGEIVALVGESGSGKSLTALTVMGLLPPGGEVIGGDVDLDGEDVLAMSSKRRNQVRGNKVAMLFQQPKVMLDPRRVSAARWRSPARAPQGGQARRQGPRDRAVARRGDPGA